MPRPEPRHIEDDEALTQYGTTTDPWRVEPRWDREKAVSLLLGEWTPEGAGDKIRGSGALGDGTDAARYSTAGTLRKQGFAVIHTPNFRNPDHVAVRRDPWLAGEFNGCFGNVQVGTAPDDPLEEEAEEVSK